MPSMKTVGGNGVAVSVGEGVCDGAGVGTAVTITLVGGGVNVGGSVGVGEGASVGSTMVGAGRSRVGAGSAVGTGVVTRANRGSGNR